MGSHSPTEPSLVFAFPKMQSAPTTIVEAVCDARTSDD